MPERCEPTLTDAPLAEHSAVALAATYRVLADPIRLRLLSIIVAAAPREVCACDLIGAVARSAATVSHHMRALRRAGLVTSERRGTFVFYRAEPSGLRCLHDTLELRDPAATRPVAPLVVSVVGPSGVGKTTLIEQLVPRIASHGYRVGTIKHAPHGHDVDKPGSDSWRHRAAGATPVLLAGTNTAVVFIAINERAANHGHHHQPTVVDDQPADDLRSLIASHLAGCDIVLAEGYAPMSDATIELDRAGIPRKESATDLAPWLTISDRGDPDAVSFDELDTVTARIISMAAAAAPQTT